MIKRFLIIEVTMSLKFMLALLAMLGTGCVGAAKLLPIDVPPLEGAGGEQEFGTDASHPYQPKEALNSPRAPVFAIDPKDPDSRPLPYYRIAADTYFLFGNIAEVDAANRGFNGNAGFVVTRDGVLVVDALGTPYLGRRMLATIRQVTDKPVRYLVITHAHPDHYYGASAFAGLPGVRVISHAGTVDYVQSSTIQQSVAYRKAFLPAEMKDFQAVVPDILLGGDHPKEYVVRLGGKSFRIYDSGQHHSHGDLVMYQQPGDILWVSDLVFNGRVTFIGDGHLREIPARQDWLLKTFPHARLMAPGHGAPQTPPFPMLAQTGRYVEQLTQKISASLRRGESLQDAVDHADLPEFANVPLYRLNHRNNANYVYRVLEEEQFAQ